METHRTRRAQDQAKRDHVRRAAIAPLFAALQDALVARPFRRAAAERARAELSAAWDPALGGRGGWCARPWVGMAPVDVGQCDNAHARLADLRPPMVAAARWGSAESIAWLCGLPEASPVVRFVDVSDCWAPERAAASGIVGAWVPMWAAFKARGWGLAALAEAYSAWLVGCVEGPPGLMAQALASAAPALAELRSADPAFKVPLSPASCSFSCSMVFAMCRDPDEIEATGRMGGRAIALLDAVPIDAWRHECQWEGSELSDVVARRPGEPRDFMESSLTIGHLPASRRLAEMGHGLPSSQRLSELFSGADPAEPWRREALDWARAELADKERAEISSACAPAAASRPSAPL